MERSIYDSNEAVKKIVEIGRNMITVRRMSFIRKTIICGTLVVAGNKLTTLGTTWGLKSVKDLSKSESKAVQDFLKNKEKIMKLAVDSDRKRKSVEKLYSMNKKVIIFDVDGTIANVEHRRHFVNQKPADWKSFRAETVNDTLLNMFVTLQKGSLPKVMRLLSFLLGMSLKERLLRNKFLSGLETVTKDCS